MISLLTVAFSLALASPVFPKERTENERDARITSLLKRGGAATAAADIKAGRPMILGYGKRPLSVRGLNGDGIVGVDKATGLKLMVIAGCMVSDELANEADAYNAAIRAWHAKQETN